MSLGTKICSVQLDSCSGLSESWLLPIQLPSDNISRELQLDWAKSEVTQRHLWVMDSSGVWFSSRHKCNDLVGGRPSRLITRSKGGCVWSFSSNPMISAWFQLFFFPLKKKKERKKAWKKMYFMCVRAVANGLYELIFISESDLELEHQVCRSWSTYQGYLLWMVLNICNTSKADSFSLVHQRENVIKTSSYIWRYDFLTQTKLEIL